MGGKIKGRGEEKGAKGVDVEEGERIGFRGRGQKEVGREEEDEKRVGIGKRRGGNTRKGEGYRIEE